MTERVGVIGKESSVTVEELGMLERRAQSLLKSWECWNGGLTDCERVGNIVGKESSVTVKDLGLLERRAQRLKELGLLEKRV